MAGEIYLSNLSGQFDYQQILQKFQELKNQQINLLYKKEDTILQQKSAFSTFVEIVKDFDKSFEKIVEEDFVYKKKASVSVEDMAEVRVLDEKKLAPLSLEFTVERLATNDIWLSQEGVANRHDAVASQDGELRLDIDGEEIVINYSSSDTLESISQKINQSSEKVSSTIFFDGTGYRLIVSSTFTGENNIINFDDSGDLLDNLKLGTAESHVEEAQDAVIDIYGQSVSSHTNHFVNVVDGLEIEVKKATSQPVELKVQNDLEAVEKDFEEFISKYNSMVDYIASSTGENRPLSGDFTLHGIRSSIFRGFSPLMEEGLIEVDHKSGHIKLKKERFEELVKNYPDRFSQTLKRLKLSLEPLLESYVEPTGILSQKEKVYDKKIKSIENNIERTSKRVEAEIENLKREFIHLDMMLAKLNDVKQRISAILPKNDEKGL